MVEKVTEEQIRQDLLEARIKPGSGARADRIYRSVKGITDNGRVYHVLTDTPEQTFDTFRVLVDDQIIVSFELDRDSSEAIPREIQIYSIEDYRKAIGPGLAEVELRIAVKLAQEELSHIFIRSNRV
ncbi:hypothetical protein [Shinella sp.]|uniref:hypothetical protein n=1 Tax=Shinella sp. TaxID=1870904 RepID=UPI0025894571|nr:hypothetical protein [Shinella sp.]